MISKLILIPQTTKQKRRAFVHKVYKVHKVHKTEPLALKVHKVSGPIGRFVNGSKAAESRNQKSRNH